MAVRKRATTQYGINWELTPAASGGWSLDRMQIILLQEIRDELKQLNALLGCRNFTEIPTTLRTIRDNTTKRPRKAKESK